MSDETNLEPTEPTVPAPAEQGSKVKFDYKNVKLSEIQLDIVPSQELSDTDKRLLYDNAGGMVVHGGKQVRRVLIDGEPLVPTGRFWTSLYARFGLNNAFFRFFSHDEVFKRISEREKNDRVRIALERDLVNGDTRMLAATSLKKPVVMYDDVMDIIQRFEQDTGGVRYHGGVIVSTHTPRIGQSQFKIAGDKFSNKFELHCPVDGFGQPSVYLSLLRWVCSNGAVGFANAFKTSLVLGGGSDDTRFAIQRALDSFTNDEGYAMMRSRFETATRSWASIREHQVLYKILCGLQNDAVLRDNIVNWRRANAEDLQFGVANTLLKAFDRVTPDPMMIYRSEPNMMSAKRQRTLPVACKVYDMINFATELASHHVSEHGARQLQAWVGEMLAGDYDLEDSCDEFSNWRDMFLSDVAAKSDKP